MHFQQSLCYTLALLLVLLPAAQAQSGGGVGGSQSQSTQTFPGANPPPSTSATPKEARESGSVPGTAKSSAAVPAKPAGQATTAPTPKSGTSNAAGSMSTIVVSASAEGSVLPNDQVVSSVFGTDMSVQDTPRNVSAISSELISSANINGMGDFVKVAPSAYTTDQFGVANNPVIRGQLADVFVNGMERTTRENGPPTSFNSVESANVVLGPPSSVLGPTINTGGYVDLVTKQPFFDRFHDDTEFTYGSYDEKIWTEDFGGPINKDMAYRVSYQGNYSGSYYNNVKTNSNDGYIAWSYHPSTDFSVDFNSEFYDGRFDENTGINRPTQGLISSTQYSTGGTYPFGGTSAGGPGVIIPPVPAPASNQGTFGGLIYSPGTVPISKSASLISPIDSDFAKDVNAELVETYNANDSLTLINRTYYEYENVRNAELAQTYTNLTDSNIVTDRAEAHLDFDLDKIKNEVITGVSFKYVNVLNFGDFENEYLNDTDLSTGIFPNVTNQTVNQFGQQFPVYHVAGTNLLAATGALVPNTTAETAYEASAFFQHQITFTPQWIVIYSGRADTIFDRLSNPIPGEGVPSGLYDSTMQTLGTGDISVDYKPKPWVTLYTTFDFNQSFTGNQGGGFDYYGNGGQSSDYHFPNYLFEGGGKFDLLNHTLSTTVDGYYQTHFAQSALGGTDEFRTVGAEVSTIFQPDKHFYITLNESYLHSVVVNPAADYTENVYDAFSTNSVGVGGTGVGSPNFTLPPGDYREAGLPDFIFAGTANYKFDNGFGANIGYTITSPISTSDIANVWIPWQYEIDASLFYERKNFSAKITFFNITDQENFSTGGTISQTGNDLITIQEPFHMEGTIGYHF